MRLLTGICEGVGQNLFAWLVDDPPDLDGINWLKNYFRARLTGDWDHPLPAPELDPLFDEAEKLDWWRLDWEHAEAVVEPIFDELCKSLTPLARENLELTFRRAFLIGHYLTSEDGKSYLIEFSADIPVKEYDIRRPQIIPRTYGLDGYPGWGRRCRRGRTRGGLQGRLRGGR